MPSQAYNDYFDANFRQVEDLLPECADNAATICVGSDRYPCTIIGHDKDVLIVRQDEAKVVGGSVQDGSAEYEFYRNANGPISYYRELEGDRYQQVVKNEKTGRYNKVGNSRGFYVGRREKYYDPHF